jgi:hypothetical protein
MDRLSSFHNVDICVRRSEEWNMGPANTCKATERNFLLYNGIHYDSVSFRGFEADNVRQIAVDDMRVWEMAMHITRIIQASGRSKSDGTVTM